MPSGVEAPSMGDAYQIQNNIAKVYGEQDIYGLEAKCDEYGNNIGIPDKTCSIHL